MKSILFFICFLSLLKSSFASDSLLDTKWKNLGGIAGLAQACNSPHLLKYEDIISALVIIDSPDNMDLQFEILQIYSQEKINAYKKQVNNLGCDEINARFKNQQIFKFKIIDNNTIVDINGKTIKLKRKIGAKAGFDKINSSQNDKNKIFFPQTNKTKILNNNSSQNNLHTQNKNTFPAVRKITKDFNEPL